MRSLRFYHVSPLSLLHPKRVLPALFFCLMASVSMASHSDYLPLEPDLNTQADRNDRTFEAPAAMLEVLMLHESAQAMNSAAVTITCPPDITVKCLADIPNLPRSLEEFLAVGGSVTSDCNLVPESFKWDELDARNLPGPDPTNPKHLG